MSQRRWLAALVIWAAISAMAVAQQYKALIATGQDGHDCKGTKYQIPSEKSARGRRQGDGRVDGRCSQSTLLDRHSALVDAPLQEGVESKRVN